MSAKTKIVVLHMKEIIYTAIFVILGNFTDIIISIYVFPKKQKKCQFRPGIYARNLYFHHHTQQYRCGN